MLYTYMQEQAEQKNDIIYGRNPVLEAIKSERAIDTVMISRGDRSGSIGKIIAVCHDKNIVVKEADIKKLDMLCGHGSHQGVLAFTAAHDYAEIDDIFAKAENRGEPPFIIICDEIEDPHNLGAIIRTADAAGAHGIIIPKRRSASLSYAVGKVSAGAVEYVPVAKVSNLASTIDDLKKRGLWVYGADMDGVCLHEQEMTGAIALVIGSEGKGLGRLIREKCDCIVSIPMHGQINSLNASVAAGILMFEIAKQRRNSN